METRYISLDDAVQCANDLAEDFAGEGLDSASHGAKAVAEWLKDIPAAAVVEKTEWDKLMFLVDAANQILEAAKWISVKERLPEKGEVVLAFGTRIATTGQYRGVTTKPNCWRWKGNTIKHVSHWMPLPEPPKEGCGENE